MITAILAALFLLVPVGATTAYLTSKSTASQTIGGVGRWCSVPNPAEQPNVYRLKDFPTYFIKRFVDDHRPCCPHEFGSGGGKDGRLGVRAWACSSSSLTTGSNIKVTSWRNTSASPALNWLQPVNGSGLPSRRLNPSSGLGQELTKLHREGTSGLVGARLGGDDRARNMPGSCRRGVLRLRRTPRRRIPSSFTTSYLILIRRSQVGSNPTIQELERSATRWSTSRRHFGKDPGNGLVGSSHRPLPSRSISFPTKMTSPAPTGARSSGSSSNGGARPHRVMTWSLRCSCDDLPFCRLGIGRSPRPGPGDRRTRSGERRRSDRRHPTRRQPTRQALH